MTDTEDRLVPRTHSDPQAGADREFGLLDLENDIKASREMADAVFELVQQAALHGATERDFNALLRCCVVLQNFTSQALEIWQGAIDARQAA